jgi:hypothetical protein
MGNAAAVNPPAVAVTPAVNPAVVPAVTPNAPPTAEQKAAAAEARKLKAAAEAEAKEAKDAADYLAKAAAKPDVSESKDTTDFVFLEIALLNFVSSVCKRAVAKGKTFNHVKFTRRAFKTRAQQVSMILQMFCDALDKQMRAAEEKSEINAKLEACHNKNISVAERMRIAKELTGLDFTKVDMSGNPDTDDDDDDSEME